MCSHLLTSCRAPHSRPTIYIYISMLYTYANVSLPYSLGTSTSKSQSDLQLGLTWAEAALSTLMSSCYKADAWQQSLWIFQACHGIPRNPRGHDICAKNGLNIFVFGWSLVDEFLCIMLGISGLYYSIHVNDVGHGWRLWLRSVCLVATRC